jgi:hypothetical protein
MTDTATAAPPPIPQGSESLEVWSVLSKPWERLGTIIRRGGRHGTIVCTPQDRDCLLNRPKLLGYDAMDYLTGWTNCAVACWPRGQAPGAPTTHRPSYSAPDVLTLGRAGSRSANRSRVVPTRSYRRGAIKAPKLLRQLERDRLYRHECPGRRALRLSFSQRLGATF